MPRYALFRGGEIITSSIGESKETLLTFMHMFNEICKDYGITIQQLPEERGTENSTGARGNHD